MSFYEHNKRSVLKSITFRVIVLTSDFLVVYFVTHKVDTAIELILATNVGSTVLYYLHERAWNYIDWGKNKVGNGGNTLTK